MASRLKLFRRYRKSLGLPVALKASLSPQGARIRVPVAGENIWVRAGTTDLAVAISSLARHEFAALADYLPASFSGLIVDAGGYIGTASVALRRLFPHASIILVEPSAENMELARLNTAGLNVRHVAAALTAADTPELALRDRHTGAWGFTVVERPNDSAGSDVISTIPGIGLASLIEGQGEPGILKLDIEGGERQLLELVPDVMDRFPVVLAELHDRIIEGCTEAFFNFSRNRQVIRLDGEKYLSLRR